MSVKVEMVLKALMDCNSCMFGSEGRSVVFSSSSRIPMHVFRMAFRSLSVVVSGRMMVSVAVIMLARRSRSGVGSRVVGRGVGRNVGDVGE